VYAFSWRRRRWGRECVRSQVAFVKGKIGERKETFLGEFEARQEAPAPKEGFPTCRTALEQTQNRQESSEYPVGDQLCAQGGKKKAQMGVGIAKQGDSKGRKGDLQFEMRRVKSGTPFLPCFAGILATSDLEGVSFEGRELGGDLAET